MREPDHGYRQLGCRTTSSAPSKSEIKVARRRYRRLKRSAKRNNKSVHEHMAHKLAVEKAMHYRNYWINNGNPSVTYRNLFTNDKVRVLKWPQGTTIVKILHHGKVKTVSYKQIRFV